MSQQHLAALAPLGWSPSRQAELEALGRPAAIPARVARVDRGSSVAVTAAGPVRVEASALVAGDWVALEGGRLLAVLTRGALLSRRAAGRPDAEQAIAANIDVVAVVHGLDRPLRDRRLHRALALAWESGATPVVVLTKADVDAGAATRALDAEVAFGVTPCRSARARARAWTRSPPSSGPDRTLVLIGESGAGKSTLVNALTGREALATGPVRDGDHKGRHTTTARRLVPLPGGGALIDTPGVRELGLWGSPGGGVQATSPTSPRSPRAAATRTAATTGSRDAPWPPRSPPGPSTRGGWTATATSSARWRRSRGATMSARGAPTAARGRGWPARRPATREGGDGAAASPFAAGWPGWSRWRPPGRPPSA